MSQRPPSPDDPTRAPGSPPGGSAAPRIDRADELSRIIGQIRDDQVDLRRALAAEQGASAELRATVERLTGERVLAEQRAERQGATIDRLSAKLQDQERHYQGVVGERDLEIADLRRRTDEVGDEWSIRFRRLAVSHEREVDDLEHQLAVTRREIEALRAELAIVRTRAAARSELDELFGRAETHYVVDGDALVSLVWPDRPIDRARTDLVALLEEHGRQTGARAEVLFATEDGLEHLPPAGPTTRVRVPNDGVDLDTVLARVEEVNRAEFPTILVTDRRGFDRAVATSRFARRLGLTVPTDLPALEASSTLDMVPAVRAGSGERA